MKKPKLGTLLFGLVLIFIGAGYLYESLGFGDFKIFFNGWWLYLIILLMIVDMTKNRIRFINVSIVLLCVWELLYRYDIVPHGVSFAVIFALLFILWGIYVLFGSMSTDKEKVCILKDQTFSTYAQDGRGIRKVQCILGHCVVDLENGNFEDMQAVKVNCVLGSVDIIVPSDIKISSVCSGNVLGSFSDKTYVASAEKEILLDYHIVLGNINLKNKGENE